MPDDFKGDMQNLSAFVSREVSAAENCRRPLEPRWRICEQIYRMEPNCAGDEIIEGMEVQPDSIGREVCQRIATATRSALFSASPIMQALPDGNTLVKSEDLERGMQTLIERMGLDTDFERSLLQTCLSNAAIIRCRVKSTGEIISERIHPQDFVIGPNYDIEIKDAHLVGHRTYLAGWKIVEAMQNPDKAARWRTVDFSAGSPETTDRMRTAPYAKSLTNQYGETQLYQLTQVMELIVKLPVKRGKKVEMEPWLVVHLPDQQQTVYAVRYPLSVPWYEAIRFERETGTWWSETSVMNTIQGYCNDMTNLKNTAVQGARYKAFPTVIVSGGSFKDRDIITKPGHVEIFDQPVEVTVVQTGVDIGECMAARSELRENVFGMTGISQLGTGQQLKSGTTATEASELASIQQQAENVYAKQAAVTLESICAMIQEYCQLYPATINEFYGDALTDEFWASIETPVRWTSSGKSADNSPAALLAKFQMMHEWSQDPEFGFIKHELGSMLISALQLPVEKEKLQMTEDQVQMMLEMYQQQAMQAKAAQSGMPDLGGAGAGIASGDMPVAA